MLCGQERIKARGAQPWVLWNWDPLHQYLLGIDRDAFAREFLRTTFLWSCFWLNEREVARRPWLHQGLYAKIDQLLREEVPVHFCHRKLESEYAVYLAP